MNYLTQWKEIVMLLLFISGSINLSLANFTLLNTNSINSQEAIITVTGTVTDAKTEEPLIGATVQIKETGTGTITDYDGTYSIEAENGAILVFSYTGYKSVEAVVNGSTLDIALGVDALQLKEVVVTAQKRVQSAQDIGIAISAFGGEELQDRGITSVLEVQDITPNLRINHSNGGGIPQYSIRGVGNLTEPSVVSSSPVAIHINEVPHPYPVTSTNILFDLERVEVLRGPQGDLFGLNTTGGTINYITAKPTKKLSGFALAEYGNYNRYKIEGAISGPLSSTLRARLAISRNERTKGWQTNATTGEKLGEMKKQGARLSLQWEPSNNFTADVEAHYGENKSDAIGWRLLATFNTDNPAGLVPMPVNDFYETRWSDQTNYFDAGTKPFVDHESWGLSSTMNWRMESVQLTSVTGYDKFDRLEFQDWDGSRVLDSDNVLKSNQWAFSQELRLSSNTENKPLTWVFGANYATDEVDLISIFDIPDNPLFPATAGQAPTQNRDIWALFGHTEYLFAENRMKLTAGLRYTAEKRGQVNQGTFLFQDPAPGFDAATLEFFGLGGLGLEPLVGNGLLQDLTTLTSALFEGGDAFVPGGPFTPGAPLTDADFTCFSFTGFCQEGGVFSDEVSFNQMSGKLGLDYIVNEDVLLYTSASRGFKSGGFLDAAASVSGQFAPSKAEILWAYELGLKSTLAGRSVRLNASTFYYDYKNQQVGGFIADPIFGALGVIVNAPKTEIYGAELDFHWVPMAGMQLQQSIGYTKGKFKEFEAIDGAAVQNQQNDPDFSGTFTPVLVDRSGEAMSVPELQLSGYASYETLMNDKLSLRFAIDYSYESATVGNNDLILGESSFSNFTGETTTVSVARDMVDIDPSTEGIQISGGLDARTLFNARISLIGRQNQYWEVTLFGKNLFGTKYREFRGQWNSGVSEVPGMPRTLGVRLNFKF